MSKGSRGLRFKGLGFKSLGFWGLGLQENVPKIRYSSSGLGYALSTWTSRVPTLKAKPLRAYGCRLKVYGAQGFDLWSQVEGFSV